VQAWALGGVLRFDTAAIMADRAFAITPAQAANSSSC
jgi:hypothetical protein